MIRHLLSAVCLLALLHTPIAAQTTSRSTGNKDAELKFVLYVSRHGVRSPTGKISQYSQYSKAPWPTWDVPPGYLTQHGYDLMKLFGAYDRMELTSEGLLTQQGCGDAARVTFYADSDQRTRETGKALAEGLFPGCNVPVQSLPEGTNDPLFHPVPAKISLMNPELAMAAIAGRIGGNPNNLTEAYRKEITSLDDILSTCGDAQSSTKKRTSLLEIPATLSHGKGDHVADLRGPLNTASTLTEDLLLEYTQGMNPKDVGWGCVDGVRLRSLIDLHTAAVDFTQRTPAIASMQASNLLDHINKSIEQAVTQRAVPGASSRTGDQVLFLVGHDTNLSNIAGLLNLTWIADGRRDDTPPGAALIFELWKRSTTKEYFVRVYFTEQTLEQMRSATTLTSSNPPERVPLFLPGCSREDYSCTWSSFSKVLRQATASQFVQSR